MIKIISIPILIYALVCLFLYIKQRSILFFPTAEVTDIDTETLWLKISSGKLKIWKLNQGKPAIIYFGGNSEAVEANIADYQSMFRNHTVYIVNYRGFGGSSGSPTEQALFEDALAIYDQLKTKHETISVIGRSLGSGVASYLASKRDILKLALITPYDSISNVAQTHYPAFPVKWLVKDPFNSISYAPLIHSQILVLYAEKDLVVPFKHTRNLLNVLPQADSKMIRGTAHNDISSNPVYQKLLADFFNHSNDQ